MCPFLTDQQRVEFDAQEIFQAPGEIVLTLEVGYHLGFNLTPSGGEAVNPCFEEPDLTDYIPCDKNCQRFRECDPIELEWWPTDPATTKLKPQKPKRSPSLSITSTTHQPETKKAKYYHKSLSFPIRNYSGPGISIREKDRRKFGIHTEKMEWTSDIIDPLKLGDRLNIDHDNKCERCEQLQGLGTCCLEKLSERTPQLQIIYFDSDIKWGVVSLLVRVS